MNLKELEKLLEKERQELNQMANQHGLRDNRVLDKSLKLDRILDVYNRAKLGIFRPPLN
ncbi:aspartyl-phosphate phosphatase Spo0E family protein [Paenibacillus sp. P96]|uniref:Aspartyl-phosphate phosphatase Spo0E family protein n=1 Tax=Paenibacillus zeirhizosphaerae TaxID=2987519 RepID=A0ABT9FNA2_9BACL|nr:aspartyl-phosphate phosphatase Spo0E family protein [Paenibacillus sp. P96]MDP4096205.1 aspartyl-phosphate phosphatase Spo0E family protein [Paenibacillus sp. P96]